MKIVSKQSKSKSKTNQVVDGFFIPDYTWNPKHIWTTVQGPLEEEITENIINKEILEENAKLRKVLTETLEKLEESNVYPKLAAKIAVTLGLIQNEE